MIVGAVYLSDCLESRRSPHLNDSLAGPTPGELQILSYYWIPHHSRDTVLSNHDDNGRFLCIRYGNSGER